jgi:hypothetical protein
MTESNDGVRATPVIESTRAEAELPAIAGMSLSEEPPVGFVVTFWSGTLLAAFGETRTKCDL